MSNISTSTIDPIIIRLNIARAGIQQYGQPTLFTIGIIGCILNILIFLRPSMRKNSCAIYFHASSWANFFCLTWGVLASMLAFFTNNNPSNYSDVYCKIRNYMINFSQFSSRAFIILACLDRFLLCSTSVRQRQFCRPIIAIKMVVFAILICACLPIYILISYKSRQIIMPCMVTTQAGNIYETISIWMLNVTIPTLSMSILSWLTIKRLKANAKRVGREKIRVNGKDSQLATMLIAQVLLYMVTNVPYFIFIFYAKINENVPTSSKSLYRITIESFSATLLTSFFYYVFNGWSFFVYTLTAPSFRRELFMIFSRLCLCKTPHNNNQHTRTRSERIHPMNQDIATINPTYFINHE
ncbi:unnamed protein product [Adineta steineri]|uniref:G-protein coupled receptors family 1 profile domain-containing protein n=1 Tax=Adineta steineri TaxID=433720 RepID=A0A815S4Z1_9BILA|nr:unnamed protein product [Adineta steineri]CAF4098554.1 unnamed protein product [Adineta steineri]